MSQSITKQTIERVKPSIERVIEREGYELLDLRFVTEQARAILRMFIDTVPPSTKDRGVTVEDCTHISRIVSDMLDVEDAFGGAYHLEVSSPGIFRPLTKPDHFERVIGERIKVKTFEKLDDRRVFTGILVKHENETLTVEVDGSEFSLQMKNIAKANLEPALEI